jgi:hypothetical protein
VPDRVGCCPWLSFTAGFLNGTGPDESSLVEATRKRGLRDGDDLQFGGKELEDFSRDKNSPASTGRNVETEDGTMSSVNLDIRNACCKVWVSCERRILMASNVKIRSCGCEEEARILAPMRTTTMSYKRRCAGPLSRVATTLCLIHNINVGPNVRPSNRYRGSGNRSIAAKTTAQALTAEDEGKDHEKTRRQPSSASFDLPVDKRQWPMMQHVMRGAFFCGVSSFAL